MKKVVKNLYWKGVTKALNLKEDLCERRVEGASHFLEILVAIIVVVAVAFIFKDQIVALITNITTKLTTKVNTMF